MQRLAVGKHDVVGNIYNIINGAQANGGQSRLQPFRRLLHVAARDTYAGIATAGLAVDNLYIDRQVVVVNLEVVVRRTVQRRLIAILLQPGIQVAGHAPVTQGVGAVGGDVYLNEPVALQMVVLGGRLAYGSVLGQHDDTLVAGADADFVFSTNHAARLHAAQLRLLDYKLLVAIVEHAAQVGNYHFLSGGHVGCTAYNLARLALAHIDGGHVQMVAVGMGLAGQHMAYIETLQAALDALHLFQGVNFQTRRRQRVANLLRRQVEVDVVFQPFITYIHDISIFNFQSSIKKRLDTEL